jgi:hypothetical protein
VTPAFYLLAVYVPTSLTGAVDECKWYSSGYFPFHVDPATRVGRYMNAAELADRPITCRYQQALRRIRTSFISNGRPFLRFDYECCGLAAAPDVSLIGMVELGAIHF